MYCTDLSRRKGGDIVDQLPEKQVGRPLLLGQDVEESAKNISWQKMVVPYKLTAQLLDVY